MNTPLGLPLEGELREYLKATYLKPLRDAEREMHAGRRSRLSRILGAMPMMGIYAILAQRHGHEGLASAALLVGTMASFFTLSGLLWLLRHGAGWLG